MVNRQDCPAEGGSCVIRVTLWSNWSAVLDFVAAASVWPRGLAANYGETPLQSAALPGHGIGVARTGVDKPGKKSAHPYWLSRSPLAKDGNAKWRFVKGRRTVA